MNKKLNKKFAFEQYISKWGLQDYNFYTYGNTYSNTLFVVNKNALDKYPSIVNGLSEIRVLPTLLKRLQADNIQIAMCEQGGKYNINSLDDLKHDMLVKKLTGV